MQQFNFASFYISVIVLLATNAVKSRQMSIILHSRLNVSVCLFEFILASFGHKIHSFLAKDNNFFNFLFPKISKKEKKRAKNLPNQRSTGGRISALMQ